MAARIKGPVGFVSAEHLVPLAALIVVAVALCGAARRWPGRWRDVVARALAVVIVVALLTWQPYLLLHGRWSPAIALPVQLCDVGGFVAAAALWWRKPLLVEVAYFWGLGGTLQALLTPDLADHFPSFPYLQFYVTHGAVVLAGLFLVIGLRLRPRAGSVPRIFFLTLGFAAIVAVVDLVTGLPADHDIPFLATRLVVAETYGHFLEHGNEIEAALPRTADDFVRSIDRVWKPFRAAVRERGRAGLGEPTSSGWTYKDLVAHVVGWMEQTVREMQTKGFTTGWTSETIQEYNDRSVRTHELVGPEAMIDELDTAYRRLLETLRGLPAGDVDEKIAGTMPYYTYLHWEEHFAELGISL